MSNQQDNWYKQSDPREYSYSLGYGFAEKSLAEEERGLLHRYAYGLAGMMILFFLLQSLLPSVISEGIGWVVAMLIPNQTGLEIGTQLSLFVTVVICMIIPISFYVSYIGIPKRFAYPMRKVSVGTTLSVVAVGMGVSVVSFFITAYLLSMATILGFGDLGVSVDYPQSAIGFILMFLNITIVPALFEEFMFRGAVLQSLRRFGDGFAVITSAIVFSILHGSFGQMPNSFLLGLILGYFTLYTGSLIPAIALHFYNNASAILMAYMFEIVPMEQGSILVMVMYIFYLCIGLFAMMALLRKDKALFNLARSKSEFTTKRKLSYLFLAPPMVLSLFVVLVVSIGRMG